MNRTLKMLVALAPLAAFTPAAAQSANAPVVAVLMFDNGSFGAGARDYDGIGKGIADVLITDLAASAKVRVVDRTRIQQILDEQKLTKDGAVDANTAVRIGKLLGACYSVYGTYMRGPNGDQMLTVHTTSNETGQIQNPIKEPGKGDNVMELIATASTKFISGMNVSACAGNAGARRSGDAAAAQQGAAQPAAAAPAAEAKNQEFAKTLKAEELKMLRSVKLDARTMLVYSRALDAKDRKENAKAISLFKQVKDKYPNFQPAADNLQQLGAGN
jgi:TolB-like protein